MIIDTAPNGDTAQFSADRKHRYLLRRDLKCAELPPKRVTFCMLNPSTADAFDNDNTISKCIRFAVAWGATELEVVNLFSLRTPYPAVLKAAPAAERGDDALNDSTIIGAAERSSLFVCAWGNDGELANRAWCVRELLRVSCKLHHLGTAQNGSPLHPLARGKNWIPYDRQPIEWSVP